MPFPGDPDYTPGGLPPMPPPSPYTPSISGPCGEEKICDCLGEQLAAINQSIYYIARILDERLGKLCDNVAECIDEIIDAINEKYGHAVKSCDECRRMAESGLAGTLEYALACANACAGEVSQCQSMADEGKACTGCGCAPCICHNLECVSVDPDACEEEEKKKYQGWCDPDSGLVFVTKQGEAPPVANARPTTITDTEEVAFELAKQLCETYGKHEEPTETQLPPPPPSIIGTCRLSDYSSFRTLNQIAANRSGANELNALATFWKRVRQLGFEGLNIGSVADMIRGAVTVITGANANIAGEYIPRIANLISCGNTAFNDSATALAAISSAQQLVGVDYGEFASHFKYAMHAACRNVHLDPDKAIAAYLADSDNRVDIDTYWAIAGLCYPDLQHYLQAARSKPVPIELATQRFRELITPEQYHKGMREVGFLEPAVAERMFESRRVIPTMNDITRLMVRDADDETIPDWPDSDKLFEQKFQKQLREWTLHQGIPEKFMKYYWRAHWNIPSPTQLFEFWHRLRYNPKFGGRDQLLKDIKTALIQQDILPRWHDYYLAVSFRPMGRIDLRRGFNIGALTEKEVHDGYLQIGYSDADADKQLKLAKRLRDISAQSHRAIRLWTKFKLSRDAARQRMLDDGLPDETVDQALSDAETSFQTSTLAAAYTRGDLSRGDLLSALTMHGVSAKGAGQIADLLSFRITSHPSLKEYATGTTERDDSKAAMLRDGMASQVIDRLLRDVDSAIQQHFVAACQKGIKHRYLISEIDAQQATDQLMQRGTVGSRARVLVDWWDCEKSAIGKHVPAAQLCNWFDLGLITTQEFRTGLVRLGYQEGVAALIVDECLIRLNAKRIQREQKEAKERGRESERAARILQQQLAKEERTRAQEKRRKEAAAKARANREKQLLSAAEKLTDKCDCTTYDALQLVKSEKARVQREFGLPIDSVLQILLIAVEEWEGGQLSGYPPIVTAMAEVASTAELNGSATDFLLPVAP